MTARLSTTVSNIQTVANSKKCVFDNWLLLIYEKKWHF